MQAADVINYARTLIAEPNPSQRWPTAQLVQMVDRAQKQLVRTLRWPESTYQFNTIANVQEYALPETVRVLRVYLAGQILQRSDIPTLQGQQIGIDDQSGTVGGPGGIIGQGDPPTLVGGVDSPGWTSQAPATYPVTNGQSYVSPASPWFVGRRPVYYLRGGNLGFVPAPAGIYSAVVDMIAQPATLLGIGSECVVPDIALDYLAWKVCELTAFADDDNETQASSRDYANKMAADALKELRLWRRTYDGTTSRGPNILGLRAFGRRGRYRFHGDY